MWALKNDEVKGIICIMGGCESYRVLPYIDPEVIHDNPKVFMGYSDIASWMFGEVSELRREHIL